MDDSTGFDGLTRSLERFSGEFEKAKTEKASSETLIASAEYELEQVLKSLEGAWLEGPGPRPDGLQKDSEDCAGRLRKAECRGEPEWRTAAGIKRDAA
jgi:hypothetical protein